MMRSDITRTVSVDYCVYKILTHTNIAETAWKFENYISLCGKNVSKTLIYADSNRYTVNI